MMATLGCRRVGLFIVGLIWGMGAAASAWSQTNPQVDLQYDPATGALFIQNEREAPISTLALLSISGIFQVERPDFVSHHHPPEYELRLHKGSYDRVDLGAIVQPGLTTEFLLGDLCVLGYWTDRREISSATVLGQGALPNNGCRSPRKPAGSGENGVVLLSYDPTVGELSVDIKPGTDEGDPPLLTALEIVSPSGLFTGEPATILDRLFEVDADHKLFKMRPEGVGPFSFGNVVASGLTHNQVVTDLCVDGAWSGGGGIHAEYQYPESASVPFICEGASAKTQDIVLNYAPESGDLVIEVPGGGSGGSPERMTTFEVRSESGLFIPENAENLTFEFDHIDPNRILKQTSLGFDSLNLGPVLPADLSAAEVAADLSIDGTTLLGSRLGEMLVVVPEPAGAVLFGFAAMVVLSARRRTE